MKTLLISPLILCAMALAGFIDRRDLECGNHPSLVDSLRLLARPPAIGRTAVFLTGRPNCTVEFR